MLKPCHQVNCEISTQLVSLASGDVVCSACPNWAVECEARRLLTYPAAQRKEAMSKRKEIRKDISQLEAVMKLLKP